MLLLISRYHLAN